MNLICLYGNVVEGENVLPFMIVKGKESRKPSWIPTSLVDIRPTDVFFRTVVSVDSDCNVSSPVFILFKFTISNFVPRVNCELNGVRSFSSRHQIHRVLDGTDLDIRITSVFVGIV